MELRRYWFAFDGKIEDKYPPGVLAGCGVTAHDRADAEGLFKQQIFRDRDIPHIKKCIENVDVSTLDPNHVLSSMGLVVSRGIWFPEGYLD